MIEPGANLKKPIIEVRHSALERSGESIFRSICPVCRDGMLPVCRDQETYELIDYDYCVLCAQRFRYLDEAIGGAPLKKVVR